MHIRATRLPGSPLSLRFGRVVQVARLRAFVSTGLGGSFRRGRAWANEPVSKNAKL